MRFHAPITPWPALTRLGLLLAILAPAPVAHEGVELPKGFLHEELTHELDQPVAMAFAADGRLYVAEKAGRVWPIVDHAKAPLPLIDLSEEITNYESHGLKGFALHPDFLVNGHYFVLYEVDRHHLDHFGTPSYDPLQSSTHEPTIARVTRFTADVTRGYGITVPGSRRVLIGEDITNGLPVISVHESGALLFGQDGSLLVTTGDGDDTKGQGLQALIDGITTPAEALAANFRAQMLESHCGKLLRVDPETGDGLPSNPFFDPGSPRSPRSRVWALGFRNPFRAALLPAQHGASGLTQPWPTPNADPYALDAHPGLLVVGDVGASDREELNLVHTGGQNYGWPLYEGLTHNSLYAGQLVQNLHAPNPLFGTSTRGHGLCNTPYYYFQDLLRQESLAPLSFSNGCDPSFFVRPGAPFFEHTRPYLEWGHGEPVRVRAYDSVGKASELLLGDPNAPIAGAQFDGSCSVAGTYTPAPTYPAEWRGYFHADYTGGWLQLVRFDEDDAPVEIVPFAEGLGPLVDVQAHPHTGQLWTLDIEGSLARIRYVYGDLPPTAEGEAAPHYGPEPLLVDFSAHHSSDPEGLSLSHSWDFGDGLQSSLETPRHVFPSLDVTSQGTPISLALSLSPPQSTGAPGYDPAVIQDGVYAKGGAVLGLQYLTQHDLPWLKLGVDWVGYEFSSEHSFHGLDWQEGMEFGALGGWFDAPPTVQVRTAGVWNDVNGLSLQPAYAGQDGQAHTRHELMFHPRVGDAIRLYGDPGGSLEFFSTVELRVLAAPPTPLAVPTRYDVQLAVTDAAGSVDQVVVPIYVNDTPPVVTILSPAQGISYDPHLSVTLPLDSALQDAEHTLAELDASWHVVLHHNQHEHPEPVIQGQSASFDLHPHHAHPGEVLFYSVRLDVSDPLGLATSVTHYLWPQDDCNLNGYDDALDIASGASLDLDQNGVPDECQRDCDSSGLQDPFDLFLGQAQDCNQNGVPDSCDIANGTSLDVDGDGKPDECP